MYPRFFGFEKLPFRLRPDLDFLYAGPDYERAHDRLVTGLRGSSRLASITGRAGVGKTLLLEHVLGEMSDLLTVCRINQPQISTAELLGALLLQLGAPAPAADATEARLLRDLAAAIGSTGGTALLTIDDVQLLSSRALQTALELVRREPGLRLLVVGQTGVEPLLAQLGAGTAQSNWQALCAISLPPLTVEDTRAYIERRLAVAGAADKDIFTPEACASVFRFTDGVPRLINVLCDGALHAAFTRASPQVSAADVASATQEPLWADAVARGRAGSPAAQHHAPEPLQPSPPAVVEPEPEASRSAMLRVTLRGQPVTVWPLAEGRTTIGRASDNDMQLESQVVSRHHCQILTSGSSSTIHDLGSVNGLTVNGKPTKRHDLVDGDRIQIGEHLLVFEAK